MSLERSYILPCFFEKAKEAFFLAFIKVKPLKLYDQIGKLVSNLAHILCAYLAQGGFGKIGDVLLRRGTVIENLLGIGNVNLPGKLSNSLLFSGAETIEFKLFRRGFLFLHGRSGGLFNDGRLHRGSCIGVKSKRGDEFFVFVHNILSFQVCY